MLDSISIRVNYIGYLREITGVSSEVFDVRDHSLANILRMITLKYPTLSVNILRCAINQKLIRPNEYASTLLTMDSDLKVLIATGGG